MDTDECLVCRGLKEDGSIYCDSRESEQQQPIIIVAMWKTHSHDADKCYNSDCAAGVDDGIWCSTRNTTWSPLAHRRAS
jgi:hypothetical protein